MLQSSLSTISFSDLPIFILYLFGIVILVRKISIWHLFFRKMFAFLAIVHVAFTLFYWSYSLSNSADSFRYYLNVIDNASEPWFDFFQVGQSERFVRFLVYPFANYFYNSYLGVMMVFSFVGLLGYYYLVKLIIYIITTYKLPSVPKNYFYLLCLPALHFFTNAIGKDSLMFTFIVLLIYSFLRKKYVLLICSIFMMGMLRPHILVLFLLGFGAAMLFLNRNISVFQKILGSAIIAAAIYFALPLFMNRVGLENLDVESLSQTADRFGGYNQGEGTSVNMQNSNLFIKIVSYLFRPFFFDATGFMGLITSFENIAWVAMVVTVVRKFRLIMRDNRVRSIFFQTLFSFFFILIAMSTVLNNLGIAVRQKTMLFPMLFIMLILAVSVSNKKNIQHDT